MDDDYGEFVIHGRDAPMMMEMLVKVSEYLSGPGFPAFLAWIDGQVAPDRVNADAVKGNLEKLGSMVSEVLDAE